MPTRKRSNTERQMQRAEITKLLRKGWTVTRIAEHLGMTVSQVNLEWKVVVKQVVVERDADAKEKIAMLLEEYGEVKREAWEAWEKSKLDKEKEVVETFIAGKKQDEEDEGIDTNSKPKTIRITKTKEGRIPANEFLRTIVSCLDAQRQLEGLDAMQDTEITGRVNWDEFVADIGSASPDQIEARLEQLTGSLPKQVIAHENKIAAIDDEAKEVEYEKVKSRLGRAKEPSTNGHDEVK